MMVRTLNFRKRIKQAGQTEYPMRGDCLLRETAHPTGAKQLAGRETPPFLEIARASGAIRRTGPPSPAGTTAHARGDSSALRSIEPPAKSPASARLRLRPRKLRRGSVRPSVGEIGRVFATPPRQISDSPWRNPSMNRGARVSGVPFVPRIGMGHEIYRLLAAYPFSLCFRAVPQRGQCDGDTSRLRRGPGHLHPTQSMDGGL